LAAPPDNAGGGGAKLARGLCHLVRAFAWLGAAIALITAAMVVWSVTARALTTRPIQGDVELTQLGVALAISLGLPWCQLRRANIIVDFFTTRLASWHQRRLDAVGAWMVALMTALLAWRTGTGALAVQSAGETSMILSMPMWWSYAMLAPGLALTTLVATWQGWTLWRGQTEWWTLPSTEEQPT
jgi:TRAP-type C4-dicarboxylate transport system permease small subunit